MTTAAADLSALDSELQPHPSMLRASRVRNSLELKSTDLFACLLLEENFTDYVKVLLDNVLAFRFY